MFPTIPSSQLCAGQSCRQIELVPSRRAALLAAGWLIAASATAANGVALSLPARITICRQSPQDAGYREIFVSIDGEEIAMLEYGETYSTEIKPGPHRLRAHNTLFWKTLDFELAPGEHARFRTINRAGMGTYSLLGLLGVGPLFLTFERERNAK